MFVSAAVGLGTLAAMTRALRGDAHMGNFYVDMWRVVVYVFLPSSFAVSILYIAAGTPMTFQGPAEITTIEGIVQRIPRGPVAPLISIKRLGTNAGGFFAANAAHPFRTPIHASNYLT